MASQIQCCSAAVSALRSSRSGDDQANNLLLKHHMLQLILVSLTHKITTIYALHSSSKRCAVYDIVTQVAVVLSACSAESTLVEVCVQSW